MPAFLTPCATLIVPLAARQDLSELAPSSIGPASLDDAGISPSFCGVDFPSWRGSRSLIGGIGEEQFYSLGDVSFHPSESCPRPRPRLHSCTAALAWQASPRAAWPPPPLLRNSPLRQQSSPRKSHSRGRRPSCPLYPSPPPDRGSPPRSPVPASATAGASPNEGAESKSGELRTRQAKRQQKKRRHNLPIACSYPFPNKNQIL